MACRSIPEEMKPMVTMHALRHTAASQMVAGGVPIFDVAHILGHRDVKITQRYAHFEPRAGRAAVRTLERMLDLDKTDDPEDQIRDRLPETRISEWTSEWTSPLRRSARVERRSPPGP